MSIYLRLDRAPEVCDFCRSQQRDQGIVWCPICGKIGSKDFVCCPIVEIPPHGRLIDADALTETFRERKRPTLSDGADGSKERVRYLDFISAIQTIKDAPTIIPADKEGES